MRLGLLCASIFTVLTIYPHSCLAQEDYDKGYFDFQLSQYLLKDRQEIQVKFVWDIKDFEMKDQKRLTVKPFISSGAVEVFNTDLDRYISVADFNSTLPYLREEMTLKFNGVQSSQNPLSLSFTIYDTLTGKNYSTPTKKVWGMAYYKKYTELLNEGILQESADSKAIKEESDNLVNSDIGKYNNPIKFYLWYLSPAFFLYGLLKSPNGFG